MAYSSALCQPVKDAYSGTYRVNASAGGTICENLPPGHPCLGITDPGDCDTCLGSLQAPIDDGLIYVFISGLLIGVWYYGLLSIYKRRVYDKKL